MAIIKTISTASQFRDEFRDMDRGKQFTYEGFEALFNYLEEVSQFDQDIELDPIAICCDFAEYTEEEALKEYGKFAETEDYDKLKEWLNDRTMVLECENDNIIVQGF
jgi:hypothetical protein